MLSLEIREELACGLLAIMAEEDAADAARVAELQRRASLTAAIRGRT
jgi:hypothetical protein